MSQTIRKVTGTSGECRSTRPLAQFPILETRDPNLAESTLASELGDLRFDRVRDPDQFAFELNGVHLGDTLVAYNRFGTDTVVERGQLETGVVVSLGFDVPMASTVDGERVSYTDNVVVFAPPQRVLHHRAAGGGELTLRLDSERLQRRLEVALDRNLREPIRFGRPVDLRSHQGRHLQSLVAHVVESATLGESIVSNPLVRASYDELLVSAVISLPSNYSEELAGERRSAVAPAVVRRAEEFLEAHALEPLTIDQLLAECGCSRRSLFTAFRRTRGYSPMQFLRSLRLDRAREALQRAAPGTTVASVAYDCGFSHVSRFASFYRQRFRELPSETLRS